MRYALSRESREVLRQFMASKVLLAFDFDGTLAPIVDVPARAHMRAVTRQLLRRIARLRPCVVLSGRSRAELRDRLAGTGLARLIGNHGAEPWAKGVPDPRRRVARWKAVLAERLASLPGVGIEDKKFSLTVHYRHCRRKAAARGQILEATRVLPRIRVIDGKLAISIVADNAPGKGTALAAELKRRACTRALFVGDDETDEDVFARSGELALFGIRVGRKLRSRAAYFLRNQEEVDELLRVLTQFAGNMRA